MASPNPSSTTHPLDQVEIFRPGRHTAMSGAVIEFSAADVAAMAAVYDPAVHEAPHVVGHPKTDGPAYGWVQSLGVNAAGRLCVTGSRQVEADFAEMVTAGRFKKRSASFYPPEHPSNPTPGTYYLKHVGWLGATPPAIKGLADFSAAADDTGLVEFGDWQDEVNAGLWRRMREWLIVQFGLETADQALPVWDIDSLQREALLRPAPTELPAPALSMAYAEGTPTVTPEQIEARQVELAAREARVAAAEAAQAALLKSARSAGIASFADAQVKEGRWLPAERGRWVSFMESLSAEAVVVEFAEGSTTETVSTPALAVFQAAMKALPPRVEFAELAGNAAVVEPVDMNSARAIQAAATEFQEAEGKAGRALSFEQAVQHIVNSNKD